MLEEKIPLCYVNLLFGTGVRKDSKLNKNTYVLG